MTTFRLSRIALVLALLSTAAQAQNVEPVTDDGTARPAAKTDPLDETATVDLGPQGVADAILALSRQFGFRVAMPDGGLGEQTTPGLHGEMTLRAALDALLQPTAFSYQPSGEGTIAIVALPPTIAVAETLPSVPVEPAKSSAQIAEVIVTATKRPQKLRDIPQSITELSGEDLERRGAQNLADIVKLVPGVNMSYDLYAPRVTVRGISQTTNTSPTTGAILGNVSFSDAYLPVATLDANPFDLKSVEVLKGPQGTLFGASNLNGAIRYVPNAPVPGEWQARYYGQYTDVHGAWEPSYGAMVNVPLFGRDDLALRLNGFERKAPGYIDNTRLDIPDSNSLRQQGASAMLAWTPENWDIGLNYNYQEKKLASTAWVYDDDGELANTRDPRLSPQAQAYNLVDLSLGYDFGWAKLVSESSVLHKSANFFAEGSTELVANPPVPLASGFGDQQSRTYSEELRLSSPDDASATWHWLVGALGWKEILSVQTAITVGPAALLPIDLPLDSIPGGLFGGDGLVLVNALTHASAREYALYGEITRRFAKILDVTLGGRYYRTLSGGTNEASGVSLLLKGRTSLTLDGKIPEQGFNPKAAVTLHATPNIMLYAALSRGYRVGGVQYGYALVPQPQSPVPDVFKSDTIWNYEGGLRTQWFGNALHLDVTGFIERWKDPQYYTADSTGIGNYLTNVGGVRSTGGDLALQFVTPWGIVFDATAAYAKTVTTADFTTPEGDTEPSGSPWPLSPRWQAASTLAYLTSVGGWDLNTGATYTYLGQAYSKLGSEAQVFGFRQLDFQITVGNDSLRWLPEINVSLNNALDERGVGNINSFSTTGATQVTYIQPRTLNLRLVGHF